MTPWANLPQQFHNQCGVDIGGWVRFPNPAWSSLFISLAGITITRLAWRRRQHYLMVLGIALFFAGLMSFFSHASGTVLGGVLDLFTMFIIEWLVLIPALWRSGLFRAKNYWLLILLGVGVFTTAQVVNKDVGDVLFFMGMALAIALIARVHIREAKLPDRYLLASIIFFTSGAGFAIMDRLKVFCLETNHWLQGMGLWHLCVSLGAIALYYYLAKFKMPQWEKGI